MDAAPPSFTASSTTRIGIAAAAARASLTIDRVLTRSPARASRAIVAPSSHARVCEA
jgi:hypothetical protein